MSPILDAANTLATDAKGLTALHRCETAVEAEALIKLGLNVNEKASAGSTPLHYACIDGYLGVAQKLIAAGADVNAKGHSDWTPLHCACEGGHLEIAQMLITAGAGVNAKTCAGWTPIHWACRDGNLEVAQMLIAAGADVNAKTADGRTPFDVCKTDEMRKLFEKKPDMLAIRSLLGVVARVHTLLKAADEQSVGTTFVDSDTALADTLYQSALELMKTAIR